MIGVIFIVGVVIVLCVKAGGLFFGSNEHGGQCSKCRNWRPYEDWRDHRCQVCHNDPHFETPMTNPPTIY